MALPYPGQVLDFCSFRATIPVPSSTTTATAVMLHETLGLTIFLRFLLYGRVQHYNDFWLTIFPSKQGSFAEKVGVKCLALCVGVSLVM